MKIGPIGPAQGNRRNTKKPLIADYFYEYVMSNKDKINEMIDYTKDYDFDLKKLWKNKTSSDTRKWIKDTKCSCHWECIYSYNIISDKKQLTKSVSKSLKYF